MHSVNFSEVRRYDFSFADLEANRIIQNAPKVKEKVRKVLWLIPGIDNPFYGGIHTILRLADYLAQNGIRNSFLVDGPGTEKEVAGRIVQAFPGLDGSALYFAESDRTLQKVPDHDISIATLWTTAYLSLHFNRVRRKYYMIQDIENFFYPAGSTFGVVEATYRFGFYGICNTEFIAQYYKDRYKGTAVAIHPTVDHELFHSRRNNNRDRFEEVTLFFYGRPGHPRNAFELGIAALQKIKAKYGHRVRIITAGSNWHPSEYRLDDVIENLGMLQYEDTGPLYRTCDIGLSMMFTPHPSYLPFQLMASGVAVVTNKNEGTEWFYQHEHNCLVSPPSATCLFESIDALIADSELRSKIIAGGKKTINSLGTWNEQMERIYRFIISES